MTFSEAIQSCMGKYATFSGRASRPEFWWFYLFCIGLLWAASIVGDLSIENGGDALGGLVSLATFIPIVAAGSRRLHDIGKSGWWQLIGITFIGLVPLIYWYAKEGDKGDNAFGAPTVK